MPSTVLLRPLCRSHVQLSFVLDNRTSLRQGKGVHVQLTVYSVLLALGTYALHDQRWRSDSRAFWEGWPDQSIP